MSQGRDPITQGSIRDRAFEVPLPAAEMARLRHQVDPLVQTSHSGLADTEEAGMSRRALRPVHEVRVYGPAEVIEGVVTVSRLMRRCVRPIEIVRIHPGDHDWFFYSLENRVSDPRELTFRTLRVQRNLLDRLKGYRRAYETRITCGHREAVGRGSTPDTSKAAAQRRWDRTFSERLLETE